MADIISEWVAIDTCAIMEFHEELEQIGQLIALSPYVRMVMVALFFSVYFHEELKWTEAHFILIYTLDHFLFHLKNTKTHLEDKLLCYIFNNMHAGHVFNVHMHDYCIHYRWNYEWQSTIILCFLKVMCFLKVEWLHKLLQIENQTYY